MEVLSEFWSALVPAAAVFLVAWLGKNRYDARFEAVDARFDAVHGEIAALRGEMKEFREDGRQVRAELATIRSDLLNVALAVGAKPRSDAS